MRKVREILRLSWDLGLSRRKVAQSCNVSPSTVITCLCKALGAGLSWPLSDELDDEQLEMLLYPPAPVLRRGRQKPDYQQIHRELRRKGVTLLLLWQEYKEANPDGYQYSRFCQHYRGWRNELEPVMRQVHTPGEKLFVDFAGVALEIIDRTTGETKEAAIFVATLGASNYTYCEACPAQDSRSWLRAHIHAWEFFCGVAAVTVPDNLKAGVTKPNFYDPELNPAYRELSEYYDTAVVPARPKKPKDKAKVENGVQQVERWVLAPLRNHQFFSLEEANAAIRERLAWLNNRPFQKIAGSRQSWFDELEKQALKPLPPKRFEVAEWKTNVGVNIDHHVEFDKRYYSVPHTLINKRVDIRSTTDCIECFYKRRRVASHQRSYAHYGKYITCDQHRPKAHQRYLRWTPSRMINWAGSIGPWTATMAEKIFEFKPHPEQGFRSCLGLIRLGKQFGLDRLEAACQRAAAIEAYSYKSVQSILKTGFDRRPLPEPETTQHTSPVHAHLRGRGDFA